MFMLAGCSGNTPSQGPTSVTGDVATDSLLTLADRVDEVGDTDIDSVLPLLEKADSAALDRGEEPVSLWIKGRKAFLQSSPDAPQILAQALELADSTANPYLYARIRLDLSRALPDSVPEVVRYRMACRSIPPIIEAKDSLRAMQAFYFINVLYGYVLDRETQAGVLARAESFVPDSLPILQALMRVNILGLARDGDDNKYLELLEDARNDSVMLSAVAPMGAMIGADLYRLRGDTTALLDARPYAEETEAYAPDHPALLLYDTYKMRYFLDSGQTDSAAIYASAIRGLLDENTPYSGEMITQLAAYYHHTGDTTAESAMRLALRSLEEAQNAYNKAREMDSPTPDRLLDSLINPDRPDKDNSWLYLSLVFYVALGAATVIAVIMTRRKRRNNSETKLRGQLYKVHRQLASQHLRALDREKALHQAISYLDSHEETIADRKNLPAILAQLRAAASDSSEWERFDTIFTGLRPGFTENLTSAFPNLTKGELRLASLLSMDLDTKHIARLLNIQPDSVKKGRQRLRARFGMDPDISFTDFLSRF